MHRGCYCANLSG